MAPGDIIRFMIGCCDCYDLVSRHSVEKRSMHVYDGIRNFTLSLLLKVQIGEFLLAPGDIVLAVIGCWVYFYFDFTTLNR